MTLTGAVMATHDFMPPEQRRDTAEVDARSDLWSLAATLYQAVSGRSPKVIRLHELPQDLQPILAKALEAEKGSRYQAANDFREALKSARAGGRMPTAPVLVEGVLREGQCRACGTVTSDLTKKFRRNPRRGESLRVPCMKCDAQIPVWDGVCGECGENQPALLEANRKSLGSKRAEAESMLADVAFDEAIDIARGIAGESRVELADHAAWAESFVASAIAEPDRQSAAAAEHLQDARKHAATFDYPAAIRSSEATPRRLRTEVTTALLADCRARHSESGELIAEISSRVKRKEIDGLLPLVERATELRGDRKDLAKVRGQLAERLEGRLVRARAALAAGDAVAAAKIMAGVAVQDLGGDSDETPSLFNPKTLEGLGMPADAAARIRELLTVKNGIFLVSSPPLSGSSTTFDTVLLTADRLVRDFASIDNADVPPTEVPRVMPFRYSIAAGDPPVSTLEKAMLEFPKAFVTRDLDDADLAKAIVSLADDCQLVVVSIRAADAIEAIEKLLALGIAREQLARCLLGSLSARLVRKLCRHCSESLATPSELLKRLKKTAKELPAIKVPSSNRSCPKCAGRRYVGRTAIFELASGATLRKYVAHPKADRGVLRQAAIHDGLRSLREAGLDLIAAGTTSLRSCRGCSPQW